MKKEEILEIVKQSFYNNITSWSAETILGLESGIDGFNEFVKEIEEKLNEDSTRVEKFDRHGFTI